MRLFGGVLCAVIDDDCLAYVQQTETQISLDQAIERQVWVKEYQNTSFSASVKKSKKEKEKEKE